MNKSWLEILARFLWMLVSFLLVELVVFLPLFVLGLACFPAIYAWAPRKAVASAMTGETIAVFAVRWLDELFGNHEDGLLPKWWRVERGGTAYGWFLRNPVCNMRFWPVVSTRPDPESVRYVGTIDHVPDNDLLSYEAGWFFCWQGAYSGLCWQGHRFGFWIGWKTNPRDRLWIYDYRWSGLGTAFQFWKVIGRGV